MSTMHRQVPLLLLREALSYNPDSGDLIWKVRPVWHFAETKKRTAQHTQRLVNSAQAGKPAGSATEEGYRIVTICGVALLAHRVAFAIATGRWPKEELDHINGDKGDNRLSNLREVDRQGNALNLAKRKDNRSGVIGVGWYPRTGKWRARITIAGKTKAIGHYSTFEEACAARARAQHELGFHPNHGR